MLRIAVISLLVANLLLLGFQGSKPAVQPETIAKQTVVNDSSIPTIHLFSEMVQDQDLLSGNRRCFSLGPFHSSEDKNEIQTQLKDVLANISERETLALVEKGYWVYMPPYESLLEANQALLSLQALGLKDIGIIYNGDLKNAISLGYFLRQENALRRKKDLEDRNFTPMIRVQRQSETRYWLDYEQNPGSALITIDMQNRPNDFMRRSLPCPDQNPFETTAGVSVDPAVETERPQTQLPEKEAQPALEENIEPRPVEISEPQLAKDDSSQPEADDGAQPTEEIDFDVEESIGTGPVDNAEAKVPEPAIETESENDLGAEPQNTDEAELEVLEDPVDDTLQQQVETPEEGDGLQVIEDDAINAAEIIDSTPVDGEKAVPGPVIETKPENSVGTGPIIGFGTELEDSDATETDDG